MKRELSRRDFLKLAGLGLGAMAFTRFDLPQLEAFSSPKRLPQFPNSEIIGRVTDVGVDLRSSPTNDPGLNNSLGSLPADTLLEWGREVIGNVVGGLKNQRYVETPQGYVYGSVLQPTRNRPNTPITEIPPGMNGFWAEVTVPYVDLAHEGNVASPWLRDHLLYNFPPRLYYGQVVWMDQIRTNNGFVEYRWNEDANGRGYGYGGGYGEFYWADGAGFKVLTEDDVSMISPEVDPAEKTMALNLDYQTLSCFEGNREVYFCRVSSGKKFFDFNAGVEVDYSTPAGTLLTHWKIISKNMTAGDEASGYSTPAVPWCTYIQGGVAIHGSHWHNAYGERRSHGCINVLPEDAKWIFRWSYPHVSLVAGEERRNLPQHGTIVYSKETKF
ncbi:MAG TPA: L,D-transpeptidase family protein [Anaerolineales bacterium]|nr:L,D-transpeptidase family protein [Anaerolineales bacterium]